MHDVVYDTLRKLPRRIDNRYVFPGKVPGSHLTEIPHSWEQFLKKAGVVDFHWHDFRHYAEFRIMPSRRVLPLSIAILGFADSA